MDGYDERNATDIPQLSARGMLTGMAKLIQEKGGEATEFRHSHPNMTLTLSKSDVSVAKEISRMHPNTNFFVDCPITKESRQYNSSSEFNTLREITITPANTILESDDRDKIN